MIRVKSILRQLPPRYLVLALAVSMSSSLVGPYRISLAKNSKLSPAKIKQIKKSNKSFNNCRKDAVAALKDGAPKKKFEIMLNTCEENFPGASLYIACKKEAVRSAVEKKLDPNAASAQCQRYLVAASFDSTQPLPFFAEKGQLYFAGIGINKAIPIKSLQPPNFECEPLRQAAAQLQKASYFLFGNHPRAFATLTNKQNQDLKSALNFKKIAPNGFDVPGFGKVFGDPTTEQATVFFPTAPCDFDGKLSDIFAGLSTYYLLDGSSKTAVPYFGIAYYESQQTSVSTADLIQHTIKVLAAGAGTSFKGFSKGSQNKNVTFIASHEFKEIDDEHDPKNLCNAPRDQRLVGIIQAYADQLTKPEYVLIANVNNLCNFGDKLARRLTE